MDLLVIVLGLGLLAMLKGYKTERSVAIDEGSIPTDFATAANIPVGRNLEGYREPNAFMKIVKEMGLG